LRASKLNDIPRYTSSLDFFFIRRSGRDKARCIGIGKYKENTKETSFLLRQFHVVFAAPIIASLPMTQCVLRVRSIVQVQPAKQTSRNRETQRPRVSARVREPGGLRDAHSGDRLMREKSRESVSL